MALRTVSNTGGNWNAITTWVGGVVPIAGDSVNFTATSGNLNVNVSTASLVGIDFTNYVNTITFNQPINTNGTVNLGTGGYTQDGTNGLIINGATTISGTTTWSRPISFTGTTYVITLSNTLNITGQVTFSQTSALSFSVGANTFNPTGNILVAHGTTTLPNNLNIVNLSAIPSTTTQPTLNGNSINISGNLTLSSSVSGMFLGGTTNLVLNGSGSQTWSHSGTAMQLRNNLTINASGTITISGIVYYNTGILTYTGGTVTTTSSTLNIGTSTTLNTSGIPWNNITVTATSTLTLTSNLAWSGTFSITAGNTTFAGVGTMSGAALTITTPSGTVTLNNDITCTGLVTLGSGGGTTTLSSSGGTRTIITSGGITNGTTSGLVSCNINIKVTGGTITSSGNVSSGGYYQVNTGYQFEIDGNVTFASTGAFYVYGGVNTGTGGTFKHTSGTVTTTGSSVMIHSMFVNSGTITWNNMWIFSGAPTITVLQSNMTVNGLLTLGYLTVGFTINNDGTARTITTNGGITMSGSTSVVVGTANIRVTGGTITGVSSVQLRNNLELAGNITFASGVTFSYNTGTLLYTSGTITTTNSTIAIGASTTLNTSGVPWVNIVINATATITLTSNLTWSGTFSITTGNTTFSGVGVMSGAALTITTSGIVTLNSDITCTGLVTLGSGSTGCTLSSSGGTRTIITSGGLTNGTTSSFIIFNVNVRVTGGTITSSGSSSGGYYQFNTGYQFEIAGNVTFSASTFYIYGGVATGTGGTFKYTSGVVTTTGSFIWVQALNFNPGSIGWNNVWFISGSASTTVLQSDVTVNGLLTLGYLAIGYTINNDGTTRTIFANNGITMSGSTSVVVGTANIRATGGTITGVGTVQLRNNLELVGDITFASGVTFYYNTGTLLYTSGTITTTNSTLNIGASTTLNTSTVSWNNLTTSGTTLTITLSSNLTVSNTLTFAHSGTLTFSLGIYTLNFANNLVVTSGTTTLPTNFNVVNATLINSTTSAVLNGFTINVSGNLTTTNTGVCSGTTNLVLTGTGIWSNTSTGRISNNLTINTSGILTISGVVRYDTGTLTYTAGTIITTGSTLSVATSTTLVTTGITWNIINWSGGTITLTNALTATGLITVSHQTPVLNGSDIYANGGMTFTGINLSTNLAFMSGTSTIRFEGTGSWASTQRGTYQNNVIINPTSNSFTISDVYYALGTITYSSSNGGQVTSAFLTLGYYTALGGRGASRSVTFNTGAMRWDYILCMSYTDSGVTISTITCLSDLNVNYLGFTGIGSAASDTWNFNLSTGVNLVNVGTFDVGARATVNLAKDFTTRTLSFNTGVFGRLNNNTITVTNLLTSQASVVATTWTGTTKLVLGDGCSWTRTDNFGPISFNMEFQGNLNVGSTAFPLMTFNASSLTYTGKNVQSATVRGSLQIASNATLLNFNKVTFTNLIITSGLSLTMNEFFSGRANQKSIISASSTTNYTITFNDSLEKLAFYVKVSRATISRQNQLTVVTNGCNNGNNVNIKFAPNQLPNGLPKNKPLVSNQSQLGSFLLSEPIYN